MIIASPLVSAPATIRPEGETHTFEVELDKMQPNGLDEKTPQQLHEREEAAGHVAPEEDASISPHQADAPKPKLTPAQHGVMQLMEYVRVLIESADKPVWALASYNNVILHEADLRNRIGIRHDIGDADGPIYLKIDRLRRTEPPEPPPAAKDWLTVRETLKKPADFGGFFG